MLGLDFAVSCLASVFSSQRVRLIAPMRVGLVMLMLTFVIAPATAQQSTPNATRSVSPTPRVTTTSNAVRTSATILGTNAVNMRAGPGLEHKVVLRLKTGQVVTAMAFNSIGTWLKVSAELYNGDMVGWVSADLVKLPESSVLVAPIPRGVNAGQSVTPRPTVTTSSQSPIVQPTTSAATPSGIILSFECSRGCEAPPDPYCKIKGNVNPNKGTRIYHLPGWEYYVETAIQPEQGDKWFCTPEEAQAAGFRPSRQ